MEKFVLHKADSRGLTKLDWLEARQTFSFGGYFNPERIRFGALRVLNDDIIAGEQGFGDHPHDNMEIITIPLEGTLTHRDNLGNEAVIRTGEIQVMSAGTGAYHSEFNHEPGRPVKSLQIWLYPNQRNVEPRYDQQKLDLEQRNVLHEVLWPKGEGKGVWIYQNAWFSMGKFDRDVERTYSLKKDGDGVYIFVIAGDVTVNGHTLNTRDGLGIWETTEIKLKADSDTEILLMEVPMNI